MLTTAQAKRREGVDVVVGVVETHGRKETEALLDGLEVISRRLIEYKGHHLREMDIDAILTQRPKLALVDELAHTNAPGCRHPKRYLDVEELLDAGIDVYATLNIQHVESLNDVVAKITGVRVRETVPDSIIDRADEVEVVDLTPEDLAQRLREGKVYLPQQAERAMGNYFKPGNLTALRELALRRTAQRVDEQMVDYMRAHAISGPWAAGERVLVGVNEDPGCLALVRYTRRLADRLRAPWSAVHIETSKVQRLDNAARDRIADALRLAERLGGEAVTIPGTAVAEELIAYARANNCTHIVITSSRRSWLAELLQGSTTMRSSARPARSASMSSRARPWPTGIKNGWRRRGAGGDDGTNARPERFRSQGLCRHPRHGGGGAGHRVDPAALSRHIGHRARLSHRRARQRDYLWALAGPGGEPGQHLGLQLFLPAAAL
jgi:two-component system sensor histidine kinase KdpD